MTAAGLFTDQDAFLGPGVFGLSLPTRAAWWGLLALLGATVFGLVLSWMFSLRVELATMGVPPREFLQQSFYGAEHQLSLFPGHTVTVTLLALLIAFPLTGLASSVVITFH